MAALDVLKPDRGSSFSSSGLWCVMVLIRSATEFQTPALRVVRVDFERRGLTPEPGSSRAMLTDAAVLSLNEERSFSSWLGRRCVGCVADRKVQGEGVRDRCDGNGLGPACRPNDCRIFSLPRVVVRPKSVGQSEKVDASVTEASNSD